MVHVNVEKDYIPWVILPVLPFSHHLQSGTVKFKSAGGADVMEVEGWSPEPKQTPSGFILNRESGVLLGKHSAISRCFGDIIYTRALNKSNVLGAVLVINLQVTNFVVPVTG
jgi:hypothetical protein